VAKIIPEKVRVVKLKEKKEPVVQNRTIGCYARLMLFFACPRFFRFSMFLLAVGSAELLSQVLVEKTDFPVPGIDGQCLLKQTEGLSTLTLVVV
jgi:hypothetical protein